MVDCYECGVEPPGSGVTGLVGWLVSNVVSCCCFCRLQHNFLS
jgi:hypothetical protein